ncbi:HAMP domain-containing histidine kinase [Pyxidicoccus parkwayensis]|uniref:histidine kinase n=1 Tax=Pyxidicoccus parkwayensis TaxID=2813578 RepID=A0ABX7P755_9BACT|nr:HAMP domain-containing sensor histidine kinase [Pyxidicoccus parkwaysis]QSQ26349.1 HAMP domain-containing histidine kinase [Pyxidicoccus parkwaysis]
MSRSLRSQAVTLTVLLGLLIGVTVAALAGTTASMERNSARMLHVVESMQASEGLEKALVFHEREQRLYEATGRLDHLWATTRAEANVRQSVARATSLADSREEVAYLDELKVELDGYFAHPTPAPGTFEAATGRMLDRELYLSRALVKLNSADARATFAADQRWARSAHLVGMSVSLAMMAGAAVAFWTLRRNLYWPLESVRQSLLRFRPGMPLQRAPATGVREIRDIASAFNETALRLERQREVQLGFLAGVAHDLRNPLQALRAVSASVRPERPLPPEQTLRDRFSLVTRQVDRLTRMVDDLLDTSRIEAGQLSLSCDEHDLIELVREAVELHRPVSEVHTLMTCWPQGTLRVWCDGARIAQVLNNLLSNAIKYSPDGGPVRVEAGSTADGVWVTVHDSGVGVDASERESIFEPFRRGAAHRANIPGVGLGLSVSRRILEAHGGSIHVESEPGHGSTFRIWLPHAASGWRSVQAPSLAVEQHLA